jgi:hypothetical protein
MSRQRLFTAAILAAVSMAGWAVVHAQRTSSPSIVGVWRATDVTITGPNARKVTSPQPGLRIFTQRHYSITAVTADQPRPDLPPPGKATDKQLADTFGAFQANAGTYEIKGNELTTRAEVAKVPNAMQAGSFATSTFTLEGNTLTVTQKTNTNGPITNPTTIKYTRVE